MIAFKQIRRFFITLGLALSLASAIGLGSTDSWAATSKIALISPGQLQIATINKDKAQKSVGFLTGSGDSKGQSEEKAKEFKAKTLEGINNSIVNPDYQPGGKTNRVEKQDLEDTEDIKAEAREPFN